MPKTGSRHTLPRLLMASGMALLLACCAGSPPVAPAPQAPLIPSVGEVELMRAAVTPDEEQLLDIGIVVFTNLIDAQDSEVFGEWVFSEIRENETHFLPYLLRRTLLDSNHWGAVRVLPDADPSMDLVITGTVLKSNGQELEIHLQAADSTGRRWLDRVYRDETSEADYPESTRFTPGRRFDADSFTEPFQDLYDQVHNDLLAIRETLDARALGTVRQVSGLVWASDLSPDSFSHMLQQDTDGRLSVVSLPAAEDPMMRRVDDMRLRHHLFIDTVDEYYQTLHDDMEPSYVIWRKYSFDQIEETETASAAALQSERQPARSRGFLTLSQRYDRYRWSKIYEQEFRELAAGFNRELAPAILELNEQVHGLSGTMEEQYIQWRRILRQLFLLEAGTR